MNALIPAAIFLLCFLPRFVCLFFYPLPDPSWSHYWNLSTGLLKFGTLGYAGERVSSIEPGYPFFLALSRRLSQDHYHGVLSLQIAVAALGGVYLFYLARRLTGDRKAAWISALLYAFYPYLIGQAVMIIEVPLFMTLLIVSSYYYVKMEGAKGPAVCGLFFALTLLTRMMVAPALFAAALVLFFQKRFAQFAVLSAVLFVFLTPYFLRNYSIDGSLIPPRSGWNLLQGNNPYAAAVIPRYNPDLMDIYVSRVLEERPELMNEDNPATVREADAFFTKKAWEYMKAHPLETLKLKLLNAVYLFYPRIVPFFSMDEKTELHLKGENDIEVLNAPSRNFVLEALHALYYGFILLTALPGIYLRRKSWNTNGLFLLIVLNFTLVYAYHWPATRLRAPLDFILIFYSAVAMSRFLSFRKKSHDQTAEEFDAILPVL